jgi:hypothetical protein
MHDYILTSRIGFRLTTGDLTIAASAYERHASIQTPLLDFGSE